MKLNYKKSIEQLVPYQSESRSDKDNSWLKLDWNESTYDLPIIIKNELSKDINFQQYPELEHKKLKKNISSYNDVDPENILIYAGSDEALKDIFSTFLDYKKTCLVVIPTYTQVFTYIYANTEKVILNPISDIFNEHLINLKSSNIEAADVIYFANPNNPTGKVFNKKEIEYLLEQYPNKLFVIDEAYFEYSFETLKDCIRNNDNIIITRTFSKAFSLASLRIGYVISNEKVLQVLKKIKNIKSVNTMALKAANLVFENLDIFNKQINEVVNQRKILSSKIQNFNNITSYETSTNFLLVKAKNSQKLIKMFESNKILVRDKSNDPYLEDCVRITVGSKEINEKIFKVLNQYEQSVS